jgi:hypothetical protein
VTAPPRPPFWPRPSTTKGRSWSRPAPTRWRFKRGIEKAVAAVVELKKMSKPTKDKKEIEQVGTISANNDETIGKLISEAMEKVGKEGVITVEEAKGMETTLEVVEGHAVRPRLHLPLLRDQCRRRWKASWRTPTS